MIANVAFWYDVGYTDGCIEVPPLNASIGTPDITFENLNPSKGNYFSEFRVPGNYLDLYNVSYLRAIYDMNNASDDLTLYGWVDSVDIQSDTDGYPVTIVKWHIDYWRTFASRADFGSGMIKRRPVSGEIPPQDYPHRFIRVENYRQLQVDTGLWYVYILYTNLTDNNVSEFRWGFYPVNFERPNMPYVEDIYIRSYNEDTAYLAPGLTQTLNGQLDELLGLTPEQIIYAGIAPMPPMGSDIRGSGTYEDPYNFGLFSVIAPNEDASCRVFSCGFLAFRKYRLASFDAIMSDDTTKYIITGFNGETILELPWGIEVDTAYLRLLPSSTGITLMIALYKDETSGLQYEYPPELETNALGCIAYIQCPTIDINTNAWSSYVYNGTREINSMQLELNAQANLVSGLTNAIGSGLTGGLMGASTGMGAGAIGMGAGMGAVIGIAGSLANYAYESAVYNDRMMDIYDYQASHQQSTILLHGSGVSVMNNEVYNPSIVEYTYDDYSLTQRANDLELYGCHVSEPMESCQSLIDAGGPLQIDNLVVRGDIPVKAKQYIKQRLANGVRIV